METSLRNTTGTQESPMSEVKYEATHRFVSILDLLGVSLLVSTYQAGKVMVIGTNEGKLVISYVHLDRAMGLCVANNQIAFGSRRQVHFLNPARSIAKQIEPVGTHDGCWALRRSIYTGNILAHEMAWGKDGFWVVNTLFSCLCTLDDEFSFVPQWQPPFVTKLIDQDKCHLNGMAMDEGRPRFVTVLGESDEPAGWRPTKATGGCIVDVASGESVIRGLSMPHSPRMYRQRLWYLNSGRGELCTADPITAKTETVEQVPGYTRGLSFAGQFAFVGLSKIRETNVFGGLPISERAESLRCGIAVIDLTTGQTVATFQFHSGIEEIFAVEVLPGSRNPAIYGQVQDRDESQSEVWIVPPPKHSQPSSQIPSTLTPGERHELSSKL